MAQKPFIEIAKAELSQAKSVSNWNARRDMLNATAGYSDKEKREALAALDAEGLIVKVLGKDEIPA